MKYKKKLWYLVAFLLLLLPFSCEKDDFSNEKGSENESSLPVVAEARTYFEDYASIAMETEPMGLHPGNIAPEWEKAKVMVQSTSVCVNVPLITEATYEGSFGVETDTMQTVSKETYYTAILQKLIVVKDLESKAFSCYIVTIIPSEENATKNNANIDKMFYAGDLETKFSGTIIYSTVTTNYTIAVEKYNKGERLEDVSLFNTGASYTADLEEMAALIGASRIKRKVRAMTRGDEFGSGGYMLPEVIVIGHRPTPTPPSPPSFPPPPPSYPIPSNQGPVFPPYTPPPYMPPVPPPSSGNSGTTSPTKPSTLPQRKIPFDKTKYPGYVKADCDCKCVADKIMRIILGGNANIGSSANIMQLWKEINKVLTKVGDATVVFNTLNSHIDAMRPIEVGVDYEEGHPGNSDKTTDHFVVIIGRGYDGEKKEYYFNYIETGRSINQRDAATSDKLRLYYDPNKGTFRDSSAKGGRGYTVTQIRPNK